MPGSLVLETSSGIQGSDYGPGTGTWVSYILGEHLTAPWPLAILVHASLKLTSWSFLSLFLKLRLEMPILGPRSCS